MSRSARHRRCPKAVDYPPITGFVDACETAKALKSRFRHGHAAFVLGDAGKVLKACLLTGKYHDPDHALALVALGPADRFDDRDVLLISMRGIVDTEPPDGSDVFNWHHLRKDTDRRGARLVDWLHVSKEHVRSMRLAMEPRARGPWFGNDDGRDA